ncbi:MAG: Ig-like domain-containing protein, partial [Armatimonadia bacterium]
MRPTSLPLAVVCLILVLSCSAVAFAVPIVTSDNYATNKNTALNVPDSVGVLANDYDDNGRALTAALGTDVGSGTLVFNSDGSFSYTPVADFAGSVTFTYTATDGMDVSAPVLVTIKVNGEPGAVDDSYNASKNVQLTVDAPGVLGNDTDPNSDSCTAVKVTDPAHGSLTLNSDGSFAYTPTTDYVGDDAFTYKANDGTLDSNVATVTIHVANDAPTRPTFVLVRPSIAGKEDLTGEASGSTDANNDGITYEYQWVKLAEGGGYLTKWVDNPGRVLPAAKVNFGETWQVRARAFDGTAYSAWKAHKTVTIVRMVASISPADAAVSVPTNTTIEITFRWPVDQLSVNRRLRVYCGGSLVPGSASWIWRNRKVRFTPTNQLLADTAYQVRLATGIVCTSSRVLGWTEEYNFRTAGLDDGRVMAVAAAPTATGAQVTVNLTSAASVRTVICNIAGRVVAELPEQDLPSGVSSLLWNGKSTTGSKVPAG